MRIPEMRYCELPELDEREDDRLLAHEVAIDGLYALWLRIGRSSRQAAVVHPAIVLGKEPPQGNIQNIHLGLVVPNSTLLAPLRPDMRDGNLVNFGLALPEHITPVQRVPSGFLLELSTDV